MKFASYSEIPTAPPMGDWSSTGTVLHEPPVAIIKPVRVAILIKGGMVEQVRCTHPTVDVDIVDADFICCNPEEKWHTLQEDIPFIILENTPGTAEEEGIL